MYGSNFCALIKDTYWGPSIQLQWALLRDRIQNSVKFRKHSRRPGKRRSIDRHQILNSIQHQGGDSANDDRRNGQQNADVSSNRTGPGMPVSDINRAVFLSGSAEGAGTSLGIRCQAFGDRSQRGRSSDDDLEFDIGATGHTIPPEHIPMFQRRERQRREQASGRVIFRRVSSFY
jgi:hypothetical protein